MLGRTVASCLLAFSSLSTAAPSIFSRAALLKPKDDPFYEPPATLEDLQPGDIIRSRPTPGGIGAATNLTSLNVQASYQIFYRTTDALGNATAAMTTVIIPYNAQYDKVVAYQTAYDSSDVNCSPSFTLQQKSNDTSYDPIFIVALLQQGWIVTTADYEGLSAAFVAGIQAGQATLDSVRATLASGSVTGVMENSTYTLWGYSGGALACEWALELQPLYAPELTIAGAALGGLTPNVTNVLFDVNNSSFSYIAFAGINGISMAYPNISAYLDTVLLPQKAAEFRSINFVCSNDTGAYDVLDGKDYTSYFKNGVADLQAEIPASVTKWGATMGLRSTPTVPMFVYKATGDEVSPVNDTDALVAKYCAAGASIQYQRNAFGEHETEAILGSGSAVSFLFERMNGLPVSEGCSTEDVLISALDVASFGGFSLEVVAILTALLLLPLGPLSIKGI